VHARTAVESWLGFSAAHLVRSVLVAPAGSAERGPFDFARTRCTVREFYDAFAAAFGMTWTRDESMGIVWFHPVEVAYEQVLASDVRVPSEQLGLPMFSGILDPLAAAPPGMLRLARSGSLFRNTFDYAVDVREGTYRLRDVVNVCCAANPTKSFFVEPADGYISLTAVNLVPAEPGPVRRGASFLWDTEIPYPRDGGVPSDEQLRAALADQNAGVRRAARNYLEANVANVQLDELALRSSSPAVALWTCIGIASVLVRSEDATHGASIETMRRFATDDVLAHCEPGLAFVTGLELARLANETRALELAARRDRAADALAGVASDACRVAALSAFVRRLLRERVATLSDALPPLAALARSSAPGKLEIEPNGPGI
jgi:hypothetical protein